jgi:hypothetical protein
MTVISNFDPKKDVLYIDAQHSLHSEGRGLWLIGGIVRTLKMLFNGYQYDLPTIINSIKKETNSVSTLKRCIENIQEPEKKARLQELFNKKFSVETGPRSSEHTDTSIIAPKASPAAPSMAPLPIITPQNSPAKVPPTEHISSTSSDIFASSKEDLEEYITILKSHLPATKADYEQARDVQNARFYPIKFLRDVCYPLYITKKWDEAFIQKNVPLKIFLDTATKSSLTKLLNELQEQKDQINQETYSFNEALIKNRLNLTKS